MRSRTRCGAGGCELVRVALIGPVPPSLGGATPGGVATHQLYLAHTLAQQPDIEVALLATNSSTDTCDGKHVGASDECASLRVHRMPQRLRIQPGDLGRVARYAARIGRTRRYGSRREVLRNVLAYAEFLHQFKPDVIHVQHPLERCTYARMVRNVDKLSVPLVVTAHSLFGEHEDETIQRVMAPNLRAADRVIAVSEHIADQAVQLGVERGRIRVIRSGVDTQRFRPRDRALARQRLGLAGEARVVLFVGNLEPRKQVDVLLHATGRLRSRVPDVLVFIVGTGASAGALDQTSRLVRLTAELGLEECVRFVGRLGEEDLLAAYAAADVFALPSSSEAQGIAALEAMACGLAVVASRVGGLIGTIADGETGCLVASGDPDGLADALADLLSNPQRRSAIGAAARAAVEERFAWRRTVDATIEVYREVLACASR